MLHVQLHDSKAHCAFVGLQCLAILLRFCEGTTRLLGLKDLRQRILCAYGRFNRNGRCLIGIDLGRSVWMARMLQEKKWICGTSMAPQRPILLDTCCNRLPLNKQYTPAINLYDHFRRRGRVRFSQELTFSLMKGSRRRSRNLKLSPDRDKATKPFLIAIAWNPEQ